LEVEIEIELEFDQSKQSCDQRH